MKNKICAICGKGSATTKDHVPPKGCFAKPWPSDLITVPACIKCNHDGSKYDESFRVYLSIHVGIDSDATKKLWTNHAIRTIKHNSRLRSQIIGSMRPVEIFSKGGIYLGKKTGVLWNSEDHDMVIKRTIRGLYYHQYNEILPSESKIKVGWHRELTDEMMELTKNFPQHSISNGDFIYKFNRAEEKPDASLWVFQFYDKYWASGHTNQ